MGKVIIAVVVAAGLVLFVAYDYLINNACVGVDGCGGSPRNATGGAAPKRVIN